MRFNHQLVLNKIYCGAVVVNLTIKLSMSLSMADIYVKGVLLIIVS